jgi:hypothetical protein
LARPPQASEQPPRSSAKALEVRQGLPGAQQTSRRRKGREPHTSFRDSAFTHKIGRRSSSRGGFFLSKMMRWCFCVSLLDSKDPEALRLSTSTSSPSPYLLGGPIPSRAWPNGGPPPLRSVTSLSANRPLALVGLLRGAALLALSNALTRLLPTAEARRYPGASRPSGRYPGLPAPLCPCDPKAPRPS